MTEAFSSTINSNDSEVVGSETGIADSGSASCDDEVFGMSSRTSGSSDSYYVGIGAESTSRYSERSHYAVTGGEDYGVTEAFGSTRNSTDSEVAGPEATVAGFGFASRHNDMFGTADIASGSDGSEVAGPEAALTGTDLGSLNGDVFGTSGIASGSSGSGYAVRSRGYRQWLWMVTLLHD